MYGKREKGCKSLYVVAACAAALLLALTGKIGYKMSMVYQTDAGLLENHFVPGHNTTYFEEEFPEQTIRPGERQEIQKKVRIRNEKNEHNVPCYIRAKILYSTEELGEYVIRGMDQNWKKGADGYYYYTKAVMPGEMTDYLMTGIQIDGTKADMKYGQKEEKLEIYIYEESCQMKDPDTQKDRSWQKAWEHALNRKIQ